MHACDIVCLPEIGPVPPPGPVLQVQLLVTSQDVDNYKQIKQDLDQLRSIVEKSELWVYKGQGPDEVMDGAMGDEHKKAEVGEKHLPARDLDLICGQFPMDLTQPCLGLCPRNVGTSRACSA